MKRKFLAVLLIFALVFSCAPAAAFAGDKTAKEPLTVTFNDQLNYLSLGDSVAAAYGIGKYASDTAIWDLTEGLLDEKGEFLVTPTNVIPIWYLPYVIQGGSTIALKNHIRA